MANFRRDLYPFVSSYLKLDGISLHYLDEGSGEPVVMLHGNPSWGYLWRKVALALSDEPLRIVMPDLVGLGLSDKPRHAAEHTLVQHARWVGALLDTMGLDRLVFVGQDWGGPIGLRALADRPGRLAGLVLANTVIGPPRPGFRPTAFHRFARMPVVSDLVFRVGGFPQNAMGWAQGDKQSIRGDVARAYRWPLRHLRDRVAPLAMARMVPDSSSHPSIAGLERCQAFVDAFTGPMAFVWGDRDPVLGRVRSFLEKRFPSVPMTRTQAGHFLQEEVPAELAAAVRDVTRRSAA